MLLLLQMSTFAAFHSFLYSHSLLGFLIYLMNLVHLTSAYSSNVQWNSIPLQLSHILSHITHFHQGRKKGRQRGKDHLQSTRTVPHSFPSSGHFKGHFSGMPFQSFEPYLPKCIYLWPLSAQMCFFFIVLEIGYSLLYIN